MFSLGKYTVIICLVIYILCSKIVDIKICAHDTFVEKPSSGNPLHVVQSNRSVTELYQSCFITCLLLIIGGLESLSSI
jgi:hypothetical protein